MGDSPSFRLDFSNSPSGQTADFGVNNAQFGGQIFIP